MVKVLNVGPAVKLIEFETGEFVKHKSRNNQTISVVVPTLGNRIEYLTEALITIESQTLTPREILIINNGKFSAKELMSQLSPKSPIKIVDTIYRAGASQARNLGASLAEGKYIAFLDDDDLWDSNYLEAMNKEIETSNAKCIISKIGKLSDGSITNLFDATNFLTQRFFLLMNPGVTGSNIIIDKDYFLSLGGYDCELPTGEDGDLILKILDNDGDIAVSRATQAVMRMHTGERLTSHKSLAKGYRALYLKYKSRLGARDTIYLIWRYKREEYRSEKNTARFLSIIFWSILIILLRRTPKSIFKMDNN
jgi:glycosyltransferase involved in cell wall biosynthesis